MCIRDSFDVTQALAIRYLREGHSPKAFRATQYSDANITTILADTAIKACPWNKIHDLPEELPAYVHCAPDWNTKSGEDITVIIPSRLEIDTKNNAPKTPMLQH